MKLFVRMPLVGKVFLVCSSLTFGVALTSGLVLYNDARKSLREEICDQLSVVAVTAALHIDANRHQHARESMNDSSADYNALRTAVNAIHLANPNLRRIYTIHRSRLDTTWKYVIDCRSDSKPAAHLGDKYTGSNFRLLEEATNAPTTDTKLQHSDSGVSLTAYAPVRDYGGMVEALIGLEMPVDELTSKEASLRHAAVKNSILAFILSLGLSFIITRAMLRPVRAIAEAAQRVREGNLDFHFSLCGSSELRKFGETFNNMIESLKESRDVLLEQSTRDVITGVFNHMCFQERLVTELDRSERYSHEISLLIIDLDRFKSINDTLGHPVGDSILRQLASAIAHHLRNIDIVARYGGDEFAVILPETSPEAAELVAESLRAAIEAHKFYAVPIGDLLNENMVHDDRKKIGVTITIGVAGYPKHQQTREGLVMAADIALCRAKHISRNSVCLYEGAGCGDDGPDPHQLYEALHDPNTATIRSLAAAVDARDRYTCGHSERVAEYSMQIGQAIGLSEDIVDGIQVAGLLHDLGKIGVPDSVLNKPGGLTSEERAMINQHPAVGGNILRRAPGLDSIIPAVLFHHERWDGAGYPNGLSGKSIPLIARVLGVADAFDAMISERPYRKPMSVESAIMELRANAGKQFDPEIVDAFVEVILNNARKQAA